MTLVFKKEEISNVRQVVDLSLAYQQFNAVKNTPNAGQPLITRKRLSEIRMEEIEMEIEQEMELLDALDLPKIKKEKKRWKTEGFKPRKDRSKPNPPSEKLIELKREFDDFIINRDHFKTLGLEGDALTVFNQEDKHAQKQFRKEAKKNFNNREYIIFMEYYKKNIK
jgi:hypothetical protein